LAGRRSDRARRAKIAIVLKDVEHIGAPVRLLAAAGRAEHHRPRSPGQSTTTGQSLPGCPIGAESSEDPVRRFAVITHARMICGMVPRVHDDSLLGARAMLDDGLGVRAVVDLLSDRLAAIG
jgi:hypothetical protein